MGRGSGGGEGLHHHDFTLQMQESGPCQKYIQANCDSPWRYCIHHFTTCINRFKPQVLHLLSGSQIFAPSHLWLFIPSSLIKPLLKLMMALCLWLGKWVGKVIKCYKSYSIIGNKSEKNCKGLPLYGENSQFGWCFRVGGWMGGWIDGWQVSVKGNWMLENSLNYWK